MQTNQLISDAIHISASQPETLWEVAFSNGETHIGKLARLGDDGFILAGKRTWYCNTSQLVFLSRVPDTEKMPG